MSDIFQQKTIPTEKYLVVLRILENQEEIKQLFKFNLFTNSVEFERVPSWDKAVKKSDELTDNDLIELRSYIAKKLTKDVSKSNLYDAIRHEALKRRYHPIKDYIESLKWDKSPRLEDWLKNICGAEDNVYTKAVSRKIFVASIARVYEPGCQFDYLTILEGRQGIRKSTLVRILGGNFFGTLSFKEDDKALIEKMRGKWFLEIDEMQGFTKADRERVKAFISRPTDRFRVSYGVLAQDFPRQCVFVGTMNPSGDNRYLEDDTGNRRYWAIKCQGGINIDKLKNDRDQLFAEAFIYYKKNEPLYLADIREEEIAVKEAGERKTIDMWEDKIIMWLEEKKKEITPRVTVHQVAEDCLKIPVHQFNKSISTRIGIIMRKTDWLRKEHSDMFRKVYYIPKENDEVIEWGE